MNKSPPRSGFHLQMMHNYFISRWVPGPFIYSGWHFFPVHWARSEKVEITLEIGREDTGAAKRVQKNYTEMLKDRCCRLSVMNILLRLSPLELFNVILLYKKRRNASNKKQKQMKNTYFSRSKVLHSQEFGNWLRQAVCHFSSDWVIAFSLPPPLCYLPQSSAIPPL